jgi:hypothetical protein
MRDADTTSWLDAVGLPTDTPGRSSQPIPDGVQNAVIGRGLPSVNCVRAQACCDRPRAAAVPERATRGLFEAIRKPGEIRLLGLSAKTSARSLNLRSKEAPRVRPHPQPGGDKAIGRGPRQQLIRARRHLGRLRLLRSARVSGFRNGAKLL